MKLSKEKLILGVWVLLITVLAKAQNQPSDSTHVPLQTVTVKKKLPKPELAVNDRYTRGMFSNMMNVKVLDYVNNSPGEVGVPIMDFLQGKIPGLIIRPSANGCEIKSSRINTITDDAGIKLYLDEQETSADFLNFLYPKDVALVKYFPPGGALISGGAASSGLLAIYTKKGEDLIYNVNTVPKKNN